MTVGDRELCCTSYILGTLYVLFFFPLYAAPSVWWGSSLSLSHRVPGMGDWWYTLVLPSSLVLVYFVVQLVRNDKVIEWWKSISESSEYVRLEWTRKNSSRDVILQFHIEPQDVIGVDTQAKHYFKAACRLSNTYMITLASSMWRSHACR